MKTTTKTTKTTKPDLSGMKKPGRLIKNRADTILDREKQSPVPPDQTHIDTTVQPDAPLKDATSEQPEDKTGDLFKDESKVAPKNDKDSANEVKDKLDQTKEARPDQPKKVETRGRKPGIPNKPKDSTVSTAAKMSPNIMKLFEKYKAFLVPAGAGLHQIIFKLLKVDLPQDKAEAMTEILLEMAELWLKDHSLSPYVILGLAWIMTGASAYLESRVGVSLETLLHIEQPQEPEQPKTD